ncbi:MAG: chemotaxis protein, partial [Spirochaetes bacterium]
MKMENDMAGQIVIFRIEKEEFGIYVKNVREIVRLPKITKVPGSPPYILGICNLRGNVIPVIDSKTRFNESLKTEMTEHTRMLVTEMEGFTNGLVIDSVSEVTVIEKNSIEPPPEMTKNVERKFLEGVIKLKDGKR